jgi:hypothetical protein
MSTGPSKSVDLLGIQPVGEAIKIATQAAVDGAAAVLGRICLPAAEEFGLLLRDRVSGWRACNLIAVTQKVERKMTEQKVPEDAHAHPRIVHTIIEQGSLTDDAGLQEMWAGLLASSCTEAGDDDSNLIFTSLLGRLTRLQARVLKYACEESTKLITPAGFIYANPFLVPFERLPEVAGEDDIQRLDRELDSLRGMSLIQEQGGFSGYNREIIYLTPTPLALHMYVRCQGSRASPLEFFKLLPLATPAEQTGEPQAPTATA